MQLHEQYRPLAWSEVVGQDKVVARIEAIRHRGLAGRAFWISGQSGTGKTTIARLLAAEVAEDMNIEEMDAGDVTAERIREIDRTQWSRCLGQRGGRDHARGGILAIGCLCSGLLEQLRCGLRNLGRGVRLRGGNAFAILEHASDGRLSQVQARAGQGLGDLDPAHGRAKGFEPLDDVPEESRGRTKGDTFVLEGGAEIR